VQIRFAVQSLACVCLLVLLGGAPAAAQSSAASQPSLDSIDAVVGDAIAQAQIPGAVVLIGHDGRIVYRKAFGNRALEPRREPMSVDTIFDIASLTKVVATTTAIMQLVEQGKIRTYDPVARYLPDFAANGKDEITVRELLTHYSGLAPDLDLSKPWQGRTTAYQMANSATLLNPPGAVFVYSDINFEVLGELVEKVAGTPLQDYAARRIFGPLHMDHTRYLPPAAWIPVIAPTQYDEHGVMLRGVVHDPTARRMGGLAGQAGVFSTADDLAVFAQALLDGGAPVLTPLSVQKMTTPEQPPSATAVRGFGWDIDSPFSSNRGEFLPVGSFGHTGFTGTSLWIDPTSRTYVIILANSVHPRGLGTAVPLRSKVATVAAAALFARNTRDPACLDRITGYNEANTAERMVAVRNGVVRTGIDVVQANSFAILRGSSPKKIGLLTNQTGVDAHGRRTIDVLAHAPGATLAAIFSPEHGIAGELDTTRIGNSRDPATGVPIYSMYGSSDAQRRPPLDVLRRLDAVFIDIQDAGVRFYTYETTLGYMLEAAAQAGIQVVVLDRPNPITGSLVQGPVSDPGSSSFVNYFPVPVRHGMTFGELARMFNTERNLGARLTVVPLQNWQRGDWFDSTSLLWVNPSPNLRSLTQAALYPGVALVEGTNVSVGRGTDSPFELLGAPWVRGTELAAYLNSRRIGGVRFVPVSFTPTASNYADQQCQGVSIVLLDRNMLDAPELGIELASALHRLYPAQYDLSRMPELLVNREAFQQILDGNDPRRIAAGWSAALEQFRHLREQYLIYK
jgi:uncharacterized protein YbbC (DUF1343 family)/CubicO group peptidase (beta-lactamase class C family)